MMIAFILLGFSTLLLIGLVQEPMSLLQQEQPAEYERLGGSLAPILGWRWLLFSLYLALGDFRSNVFSQDIVRKFTLALWLARFQLLGRALIPAIGLIA